MKRAKPAAYVSAFLFKLLGMAGLADFLPHEKLIMRRHLELCGYSKVQQSIILNKCLTLGINAMEGLRNAPTAVKNLNALGTRTA